MKKFVLSAVALSISMSSFANCRETAIHRSLNDKSYGWQKVQEPVRLGKYSQRFELRAGDCGAQPEWSDCATDRERSEVSANKIIPVGTTQYIKFSLFLEKDFQTSNRVGSVLGQVHQQGGPEGTTRGLPSKPPMFMFYLKGNSYDFCWQRPIVKNESLISKCEFYNLLSVDQMKGQWNDILLEMNTDSTKGYAKVFVNGELKVEINEPLYYVQPRSYFFKYGIYNAFVSKHKGPMPTQVAYFDEVQLADSLDGLCKREID
jgi:hypothetical protein